MNASQDTFVRHLSRILASFEDPTVDEVLMNGVAHAHEVRGDGATSIPTQFSDPREFAAWVLELGYNTGVRLDPLVGSAGGVLEGGLYRWHVVLPPLAPDGPVLALRRHRFGSLGIDQFDGTPEDKAALVQALRTFQPILIAGPTGSGKTSLLAALIREHLQGERLVIVEGVPELPRLTPCSVRLWSRCPNLEGVGRVSLARLFREGLRLRPDRLVFGELRGREGDLFVEACRTGHGGAVATIHARGVNDALERLRHMAARFQPRDQDGKWPISVVALERGRPPRLREFGCGDF